MAPLKVHRLSKHRQCFSDLLDNAGNSMPSPLWDLFGDLPFVATILTDTTNRQRASQAEGRTKWSLPAISFQTICEHCEQVTDCCVRVLSVRPLEAVVASGGGASSGGTGTVISISSSCRCFALEVEALFVNRFREASAIGETHYHGPTLVPRCHRV
jgi:hypothetical protein